MDLYNFFYKIKKSKLNLIKPFLLKGIMDYELAFDSRNLL